MNQYLPYSGTNSIQEAVIAVHFQNKIVTEAVERARDVVQRELKHEFPRFNEIHQMQRVVGYDGAIPMQSEPARLAGFDVSKIKSDANPARALRLLENMLTVNFLVYHKWQETLDDSLQYINLILSSMSLVKNPVQAFSLRYIDQYTFDGLSDESCAEMLFRKNSTYLTKHCFDSGPIWHCNSGWIRSDNNFGYILNQLNIESAIVDQVSTATVDHNAICHLRSPRQMIESVFPSTADKKTVGIEHVLNSLHDRNGEILRNILLPEMLKKIGLLK